MRLPPTKIEELRRILMDAGLYQARNEPLIRKAVQLDVLIDRTEKELSKHTLLLTTTGSKGQDKTDINPLVPTLSKLHADHARILAYLGLGNKPVDAELNKEEVTLLDRLMVDL